MSTFNKFHSAIIKIAAGAFASAFNADTDTLKAYLTNIAPDVTLHSVKADLGEIAAGNGYAAGGVDIQNAASVAGGVITVTGVPFTLAASGGPIGPFRYAVLYDDTAAGKPLLGYWDYDESITVKNGETFTWNVDSPLLTLGA